MRYQLSDLPEFLPWIMRYYLASSPARALHSAMAELPLIQRSLIEHEALIAEAGRTDLLRQDRLDQAVSLAEPRWPMRVSELERARQYGVAGDVLDPPASQRASRISTGEFAGADPLSRARLRARSGRVGQSLRCAVRSQGRALHGRRCADARASGNRWRVSTDEGPVTAREVVVAMGPWSDQVFRPLGYSIPLQVKRGYHLHLKAAGNAVLNHPVLDADQGFVLAPMNRGIRLTTPVEFANRDAPPSPVQVERALPQAQRLFPLGEAIDAKPWMGARPCLPDMLPVIGRAPRHPGLWFDFGHQHHGLTLGPVTGRLLAEMMTGETPFADPKPFAVERFG